MIRNRRLVTCAGGMLLAISLAFGGIRLTTSRGHTQVHRVVGSSPVGWQKRASFPFKLQEHSVVNLNGKVHVFGGLLEKGVSRAHKVYTPETNSWSDAAPLPILGHHIPAVALNGKIYALGGFEKETFNAIDDLFIYDSQSDSWSRGARMPKPRGAGSAAVIDGKIYVAGGARNGEPVRDFAMYDPQKDQWFELPPMPATARDHGAAAAVNGKFYMFGGRNKSTFNLDLSEIYDPATGSWRSGAPLPTGRSGIAAAVIRGCVYVFGGEGNYYVFSGTFNQTEVYDPRRNVWSAAESMPTGRHGLLAATVGGTAYLPAGAVTMWFGPTDVHEAYTPPERSGCNE